VKVVANAGPLVALGKIGLVHLPHQLYGVVLIPSAVYQEVVIRGMELEQPDAHVVQLAIARQEFVVVDMSDADLSDEVRSLPLGKGEKHAIQLGLAESADWVLLDDLLARESALRIGLKVKGTLGIIVEAYRKALLTDQESDLTFQALLAREDIWISETSIRRVWDELRQGGG